jgi:hypothetical protein
LVEDCEPVGLLSVTCWWFTFSFEETESCWDAAKHFVWNELELLRWNLVLKDFIQAALGDLVCYRSLQLVAPSIISDHGCKRSQHI